MTFNSILDMNNDTYLSKEKTDDNILIDLNLDLIVDGISKKFDRFNVRDLLLHPLDREEDARYRQSVFVDLENDFILQGVKSFSENMSSVDNVLRSLENMYDLQKEGWFLWIAERYCKLVRDFIAVLSDKNVKSPALTGFRDYLKKYAENDAFVSLETDVSKTKGIMSKINYMLVMKGDRVTVRRAHEDHDRYSDRIKSLFSKFKDVKDNYRDYEVRSDVGGGHVQAALLLLMEKLYPDEFEELRELASKHGDFVDHMILKVFREFQFYISFLNFIQPAKQNELKFCIPEFTDEREIHAYGIFNLYLGVNQNRKNGSIVTNDMRLEKDERIMIVSGPNSGGKTTFARSLGQVVYLASLGMPVGGTDVLINYPDGIFTHFERSENLDNLRGKLEDDLFRIRQIMERSTENSVIIVNEMLSSTTVKDALFIGYKVLEMLREKGSFCIFVTFLDEFSSFETAVSFVAQVDPDRPEVRTFKVYRKPAQGMAYAMAIAKKYDLMYDRIVERISHE